MAAVELHFRAIDSLIRFVYISETRWAYPYRVGGNPGDPGVGFLVVASAPFLCWFAAFSAGETQIWPGDLRVVAVLPGFCLFVFSMDLPRFMKPRRFITFAIYLTASLTVRTEP